MRTYKAELLWGLFVWAIPFVIAMFAFPLRATDRALFESVMPVALVAAVVFAAWRYFEKHDRNMRAGLELGVIFFLVSFLMDQLFFSWGPQRMGVLEYIKDIGLTYIVIPLVTVGMGAAGRIRS